MSSNHKEVNFPMLIVGVIIMLVAIYVWKVFPGDYFFGIVGMLLMIVGLFIGMKARKQV